MNAPQQDLKAIVVKCNNQLLKSQILSSYGFPVMQVQQQKINFFLSNFKSQTSEVQEEMIMAVACLIGETTIFEKKDQNFNIIIERLKEILNNNRITSSFKTYQFNKRIAELFKKAYEIPYHSSISSKSFNSAEFFLILGQKKHETLQYHEFEASSIVFESKSLKYQSYIERMCDIEEFMFVRELRKNIKTLFEKIEELRILSSDIVLSSFTMNIDEAQRNFNEIAKEIDNVKEGFKSNGIIKEDQSSQDCYISDELTIYSQHTEILPQANRLKPSDNNKKQQQKELKQLEKQNYIVISDDEDQSQEIHEQMYQHSFPAEKLVGKTNLEWRKIYQTLFQKKEVYRRKLSQLKYLGFPTFKFNISIFGTILQNFEYQSMLMKKQTFQKIISLIWESLVISSSQEPQQLVNNTLSKILLHYGIECAHYKQIINSIIQQTFQSQFKTENLNTSSSFNYSYLSSVLNKPLPDSILQLDHSKTQCVFKAKNLELLKEFNIINEVRNIRIIRTYLKNLQFILTKLFAFPLQEDCDTHMQENIINQFEDLETIYNSIFKQNFSFYKSNNTQESQLKSEYSENHSEETLLEENYKQEYEMLPPNLKKIICIENSVSYPTDGIELEHTQETHNSEKSAETLKVNLKKFIYPSQTA